MATFAIARIGCSRKARRPNLSPLSYFSLSSSASLKRGKEKNEELHSVVRNPEGDLRVSFDLEHVLTMKTAPPRTPIQGFFFSSSVSHLFICFISCYSQLIHTFASQAYFPRDATSASPASQLFPGWNPLPFFFLVFRYDEEKKDTRWSAGREGIFFNSVRWRPWHCVSKNKKEIERRKGSQKLLNPQPRRGNLNSFLIRRTRLIIRNVLNLSTSREKYDSVESSRRGGRLISLVLCPNFFSHHHHHQWEGRTKTAVVVPRVKEQKTSDRFRSCKQRNHIKG